MTIFNHEMKRNFKTLSIWSGAVGFMIIICIFLFPEMEGQMAEISDVFSSMGGFTSAFGMDKLDYGTIMGFYGVECGSMLGIGGSFFAALLGISMLAKEEAGHTAEFLLMHPVRRANIISEKLFAVIAQLGLFNLICIASAIISFLIIGETVSWKEFFMFHFAQFLLQFEIAAVCFGISAFIKRGNIGIGIGIAAFLYFLNIFGNISDSAQFVKYITPFKYSEAADIIGDSSLDWILIAIGLAYAAFGILIAYIKYIQKDIVA